MAFLVFLNSESYGSLCVHIAKEKCHRFLEAISKIPCSDLCMVRPTHQSASFKPRTTSLTSLLVPQRCFIELAACGVPENDRQGHFLRRSVIEVLISSQDTTSSGLASCSAILRSSSFRWVWVSGTAALYIVIHFQTFST